jgi:hypothetical protein
MPSFRRKPESWPSPNKIPAFAGMTIETKTPGISSRGFFWTIKSCQ